MTLKDAMCTAIANEINARYDPYGLDPTRVPAHPNDITTIEFVWDEGETSDNEDYGLSPRLPSMEVRVKLAAVRAGVGRQPRPFQYFEVNAGTVLNALIQAIMREGL